MSGPSGNTLRALVLFVLGNLVGALVSQLIPAAKPDRGEMFYLIGFLLLTAVISFTLVELGQRQADRLSLIETKLSEATTKIGDVAELHTDTSGDAKGRHFDHLADMVKATTAGQEICVLTFYDRRVDDRVADGPYAEARARYMNALLESVRRGVVYRRLLCFERFDTTEPVRVNLIPPYTLDHCRQMLQLHSDHSKQVFVKKAPAVLTADIIVIGRRLGAISVERLEMEDRHYGGAIVVYDPPNGRIVGQLRDWWNEAHENSAPVTPGELEISVPAEIVSA